MDQTKRKMRVDRRMQLRLTGWLTVLTVIALVFQAGLFISLMTRLAASAPADPAVAAQEALHSGLTLAAYSMAVILPLMVIVGAMTTFRVSGPLFAIQRFLRQVAAGERSTECQLREKDELQELCRLVNEGTAERRSQNQGAGQEAA